MTMRLFWTAAATAALVSIGQAQELKIASGWPPTQGAHGAYDAFIPYVEQNSDMTIKLFHSGSLLAFAEIPSGVRDGIAEMGSILPPFYPSEFPESNLVANLSMLTNVGEKVGAPGAVMAGATMEYIFSNEDALNGYKRQSMVYLGSLSSAPYDLLCRSDAIVGPDDLKGKKFRVGQANFGRYVEHFGGVPVSLPANEMYEAMAQGVVDCAVLAVNDLIGYQMAAVVKNVTLGVPGGVFSGAEPLNISREVWQDLTDDQRRVLLEGAVRAMAEATARLYNDAKNTATQAPSLGVTVNEPSPELVAASEEFIKGDLAVLKEQFSSQFGVQNIDEKIAEITRLIDRWKGLLADWDGTTESLTKVYQDEIYARLDPATYGMD
jgi:TRAP-type C4-dicarboxylate transport system substrate-binding protein